MCCNTQQKDIFKLTDLYLGQKSPGMIPKTFATGVVPIEFEDCVRSFTPDNTRLYFTWTIADAQTQQKRMTGSLKIFQILY